MKKSILAAVLLLAGCSVGQARQTLDIQLHPEPRSYVIFAFEQGDVVVEINSQTKIGQRVLELVQQGYYNGSFIHNAVPGKLVQFGEAYWQGREPSPRLLVEMPPHSVMELKGSNVALAVLAQPDNQHLIVGPQLTMSSNYAINGPVVPVGKVVKGEEFMKAAVKGDKIISAVIGAEAPENIAN